MRRVLINEVDARVLPGLLCWYRAQTLETKFGNGQSATYALDESGKGNNLGNGNATPPTLKLNACNGYPSLLFDGTNDELRGNLVAGSVIKYLFALVKRTNAGNYAAGYEAFFGGITAGDASIYGVGNTSTVTGSGAGTSYINGVATTTVVTNAWNLCYAEITSAKPFTSNTIMGRTNGSATYFPGEIVEAGCGTGTPTALQRTQFFNAMIAKYALTGVVGSPT